MLVITLFMPTILGCAGECLLHVSWSNLAYFRSYLPVFQCLLKGNAKNGLRQHEYSLLRQRQNIHLAPLHIMFGILTNTYWCGINSAEIAALRLSQLRVV